MHRAISLIRGESDAFIPGIASLMYTPLLIMEVVGMWMWNTEKNDFKMVI